MEILHSHVIQVAVLASGSRGNSTYVGDGYHGVVIDCGLSRKDFVLRMAAVDLADAPIDAILITHEHRDHVGGLGVLSRHLARRQGRPVPVFMSPGTRRFLPPDLVPDGCEAVPAGSTLDFGHLRAQSFSVPHDTADPVAWRVSLGGWEIGQITDLGRSTQAVSYHLRQLDVAILEFNHDLEMLINGTYSWPLKKRIQGNRGHLSNEQAADLLRETYTSRMQHIVAAHLSEQNNAPARAFQALRGVLREMGQVPLFGPVRGERAEDAVRIAVAEQDRPLPPIRLAGL